jgi:hypothetical protein
MALTEQKPVSNTNKEEVELEHVGHIKEDAANLETRSPEWCLAEKKLLRKLDMTLMPIIWTLYLFNYLDRNNMA